MTLTYTVLDTDTYTNIKEVLKAYLGISERLLIRLKNTKQIFLNDAPTYVSACVSAGDKIDVIIDFDEDNTNIVPTKMDLDILYEDDYYLVVNKPPHMPVHPSILHYEDSLSNGIRYYFDTIHLKKKIRPVNRLDRDTSGIVVFAKNEYIQECLVSQMKSKEMKKTYIAICDGKFENSSGTINLPIARKPGSIIERYVHPDGDSAITHYTVLSEKNNVSIVKCALETGRTHQIRVHLSATGHPIIGDTLYGIASNLTNRQLLHAYMLEFIHPITRKKMSYTAPLPLDFNPFLV